jgi:asparagine synthase (glutamine-hydrolysing)
MCGIAGIHGQSEDSVHSLLDKLLHRGPDGRDVVTLDGGTFGHVRLAIVDVDAGRQPMSSPDGSVWLVCNGEIYNHKALRAECADYAFQTSSDNEVVLALYEKYGTQAAAKLDGMFAFALDDGESLYMARDAMGIKPLYYGWKNGSMYFASEIKTLADIVDEVKVFPPGHYYHSDEGFVPFYRVADAIEAGVHRPDPTLADIRDTLQRAVRKRLMSDVPLGTFLSGGVDSSIISTLIAQDKPGVHSFFVGVDDGGEDQYYSRLMADFLATQHHEYIYNKQDVVTALPEVIYYLESFDPALLRSAIPNFFLSKLASEYVTVVLTGEGADELFSGYHYLKKLHGDELQRELIRITANLAEYNLQRLDRMAMAHGLEGRVPFLDLEFVRVAASVPLSQKTLDGVEKWALRKAFDGMLPDEVLWRRKLQFSQGAGSADVLHLIAERDISDEQYTEARERILRETGRDMRTKEELYTYRVFREVFPANVTKIVMAW